MPRRIRLAALLLAVLGVAALIAIRVWPRSPHRSAARPPATTSVTAVAPGPGTTMTPPSWPTAPGECDSNVDLPIVSSIASSGHTGIKVLLGGDRLRTVDFDSGQIAAIPQARLRQGEYVVDLPTAAQTYAVVTTCTFTARRILRVGTDGNIRNVTLPGSVDTVLVDGDHAWGLSDPKDNSSNGYLTPLDGGSRVRLPAGMSSNLITDGLLVGNAGSATGASSLLLMDATTGDVSENLGNGQPVAVGHGVVLWTVGCDPSRDKPCMLHRRPVAGGTTSSYRMPRTPCCGVLSPDGRQVAFTLERAAPECRCPG